MFIKLVVLILVCGSSGVGLLSVRQSRLQAAHEMAEARHRSQRLSEQVGEVRSQIAKVCTPERVVDLLEADDGYVPAVHSPIRFSVDGNSSETEAQSIIDKSDPNWMDDAFKDQHARILDESSRETLLND